MKLHRGTDRRKGQERRLYDRMRRAYWDQAWPVPDRRTAERRLEERKQVA